MNCATNRLSPESANTLAHDNNNILQDNNT